jgi:hypothetical protein
MKIQLLTKIHDHSAAVAVISLALRQAQRKATWRIICVPSC